MLVFSKTDNTEAVMIVILTILRQLGDCCSINTEVVMIVKTNTQCKY